MSIAALIKEAQEVAARVDDRLKKAIGENRDFTAEEDAADKADNERLDKLQAMIERAKKTEARVTAVNTIVVGETDEEKKAKAPRGDKTDGFGSIGEFAMAVVRATDPSGTRTVDPRLAAPANFHQETGDSTQTGYMVPPAMRQEIWELVFNGEDLVNMVDSEPTNSNAVQLLADESTPWGAIGIQAHWRSEGQQMVASKANTEPRDVKLNELYAFCLATEELLEDAPRLTSRLTKGASQAIRWKASDAIMHGDGVGKPLGFFNSNALVSVAKETGQGADTIVAQNVANMFARNINPGKAEWFINSDCLPQLMTMQLGDRPIWTPPSSGFTNAPGGFLFGRPIHLSEHCKTLGDKGDIQFVDPMGYYAALKNGGIKFAESIHLYFDFNLRAFRWVFRMGGQPFLSKPVSPANGSKTKSHFVALNERA